MTTGQTTGPATGQMIDFRPATRSLADVVAGIRDQQLTGHTPCPEATVADLLAHVDTLSVAFARAAAKRAEESAGAIGVQPLVDGWRERIPVQLEALAEAWDDPDAWAGRTRIGGTDQPGQLCALIGLDEVLVHGWDLAVATGQPYAADEVLIGAATGFARPTAEQNPDGVPGLFGPAVPTSEGATPLERLLALTGRDPGWSPPAT